MSRFWEKLTLHSWQTPLKGGLKAKFFSSYDKKWIRLGQEWSSQKFQRDDVIMGSTEVKLVRFWALSFEIQEHILNVS